MVLLARRDEEFYDRCAACGRAVELAPDDRRAMAEEFEQTYGYSPRGDEQTVCDRCYQMILTLRAQQANFGKRDVQLD